VTPEQIKLIKLSFAPLIGRKLEAGKLFYQRLFEIAPDVKSMFKSDINAQADKLMSTLGLVIANLQDAPTLVSMLENLGQKHVGYGVQEEHYDKVGAALLWTLEKMLGDAFTNEAKIAWSDLYQTAASVMRGTALKKGSSSGPSLRAAAR
jgi:hemoglobin-like flavoprotein